MRGSWFLSISTWQLKILINFRFVLWILGISVVKGIRLPNPTYFNFLFNFLNKKESGYNTCWRKNQLCYAHRLISLLHPLLCQIGSISSSIPLGLYLVPNKCLNGHDDCWFCGAHFRSQKNDSNSKLFFTGYCKILCQSDICEGFFSIRRSPINSEQALLNRDDNLRFKSFIFSIWSVK